MFKNIFIIKINITYDDSKGENSSLKNTRDQKY